MLSSCPEAEGSTPGSKLTCWFDEEEANDHGICVQDLPTEEQRKWETLPDVRGVQRGDDGRSCGSVHGVAHGTLSYSHGLLVLQSLCTGALWTLPREEKV